MPIAIAPVIAGALGAVCGYLVLGVIGALIGGAAGVWFGRAYKRLQAQYTPAQRARVEAALFDTIFPLLGQIAKADGRVSEAEISAAEIMMARMQLTAELRSRAIELFKQGAAADFTPEAALAEFNRVCGAYPNLRQLLVAYLLSMALADGQLHPNEERLLKQVADAVGIAPGAFEQLLSMARAQANFAGGAAPATQTDLATAYDALGVDAGISDAELKRAYRKLMSQNHPDKLAGQGVPQELLKNATERSQQIQAAYDLIKKHRQSAA